MTTRTHQILVRFDEYIRVDGRTIWHHGYAAAELEPLEPVEDTAR